MNNQSLSILKGIDLKVNASESIAILGASGSGKTTLLGLLAGLDLPTHGSITLLNHDITQLDEDGRAALRLGKIGFVFQNFDLLPHLTALDNVALPLELARIEKPIEKSKAILAQVGLADRINHYPRQLSGGEQQRVAIARAFVIEPTILFADEPTGSLDEHTGLMILQQLLDLNKQFNTSLIFVTHDRTVADHCQSVYQLEHGLLHLQ